jgi:plastocyanin
VTRNRHPDPPDEGAARRKASLLVLGLLAVAGATLLVVALTGSLRTEEIIVEVPAGTAARLEAGEPVQLLPRTLQVAVGDRLRVVNHDDVTHEVGPYTVLPGQTLEQTFTSPGTLEGLCTLHPSGAITIEVR